MLHVGMDTSIDNLLYLNYMNSQEKKNKGGHRYVNNRDGIMNEIAEYLNYQARTFGYSLNDDDYNEKLACKLSLYGLSIDDLTSTETNKMIKAVHNGLDNELIDGTYAPY